MYSENLETQRLFLRGLSPSDISYIFENLPKERIKEILGHQTEDEFQTEQSKYKNGYASYNRTFILFLLIERETNKVIGRCGIHNWNVEHRRAEIGYNITDVGYKNKNYTSEALKTIIEYGFKKLNLNRLEAIVSCTNTASLKIMDKFSFCKEGTLRKYFFSGKKSEDGFIFSKLRSEYDPERTEYS